MPFKIKKICPKSLDTSFDLGILHRSSSRDLYHLISFSYSSQKEKHIGEKKKSLEFLAALCNLCLVCPLASTLSAAL